MTRVFLSFAGAVFYLTAMPGWFVGAEEREGDGEPFAEKFPRMVAEVAVCFTEAELLTRRIRENVARVEVANG
ncbi:MAG: hypothetical protein KF859_08150 [Phycisphaeraceae bacterium]|nr:hypothetical protein [Phycisphaeraceae bacterium]